MNPIFKEYIDFLNDNCNDTKALNLKEGYYWLDKQIIKCFDKNGKIHKIARLYVDDKLQISIKNYTCKEFAIASWTDIVRLNSEKLNKLECDSLNLIRNAMAIYNEHENVILTSGGKDSSVVMHLVRKINKNSIGVFNNTSLDCSDTYMHIKYLKNIIIINPQEGFYQWRDKNNFIPTRFARACCSIFKEGEFAKKWDRDKKTLLFLGMRNDESNTRSDYGDYWRNEDKWSDKWFGVLPIRKWTELDIWLYIFKENIPINKKYKKGYSRVGCAVACPYYSKSTWVLDKYWYPSLYNRWHKILDNDFIKNNKALIMNCTQKEYHLCWNGGSYRKEPSIEVITEYAERNNLNIDIAKKYFNRVCIECNKRIKHKDVIGMNMKYYGRNLEKFRCKKCLMKDLEIDKETWNEKIDEFKNNGCSLF